MNEPIKRPDFVLAPLLETYDGKTYEVIGIKYGETGYYPTTYGRQTRQWIADRNADMDVDGVIAAAYSTCSIFDNWSAYEKVVNHLREVQANFLEKGVVLG